MIKTKLFAIICSASSVVVAATTALSLAVSGPRNTQSLHMLSDNNAVAYGISNMVDGAGAGIDTVSAIIDTISSSKTSLSGSITINSIQDMEELSGLGAGFQLETDYENKAAALLLNATLGSVDLVNGTLYVDSEQIIAELPFLFEGILTASVNNLESDMENSYLGQMMLSDPSYQEMVEEYDAFMAELSSLMGSQESLPDFDFDYEAFAERLGDTIEESFKEVTDAMDVTDLGKVKLNGGSYQGYRAEMPVKELSYILRDLVVFITTDDELLDYMRDVCEYVSTQSDSDMDMEYYAQSIDQLSASGAMIKSAWGMVVAELEQIIGKNIAFEMYLTDSVELAGFDFYVGVMDSGRVSFDRADDAYSVNSFGLSADLTGGKDLGDYTDIKLTFNDGYTTADCSFVLKHETNGDFTMELSAAADGNTTVIAATGSYTGNDQYFDCQVDSLSATVNEDVIFDIGFALAFQPVDQITKPSSSPEYNIWEMDEADYEKLGEEISNALEELESLLQ